MRICQFCSTTVDTHYFGSIGEGLSARGFSTAWVTLNEASPPRWMSGVKDAEYRCLNAPSRWQWPIAVVRLAGFLRDRRIDVLQTHLYQAGLLGIVAARLARTPLVIVSRHHMDQVHIIGTRFHVGLDRWMARAADRVVVPSEACRTFMVSAEGADGDRVTVVPYGFDFDYWTATDDDRRRVREEFGFNSEFVIGCVAGLGATKGHVYLLEAAKALLPEIPTLRVLLLGTGNRALVEKIVHDLHLESIVTFAGFRRDVPACMRAMDLLVHPSLSESFGQVLVEAQAVGTPVVATRVGGAVETIEDGKTGVFVPPADTQSLRAAILDLYRHAERRQALSAAGPLHVRERFSIERMVNQYVSLYGHAMHASR